MGRVAVVGGGLAGLSCAAALAARGFRVTVLESRRRLGGRAGSFADPATGQLVDACQHVSMGVCTNLAQTVLGSNNVRLAGECLFAAQRRAPLSLRVATSGVNSNRINSATAR